MVARGRLAPLGGTRLRRTPHPSGAESQSSNRYKEFSDLSTHLHSHLLTPAYIRLPSCPHVVGVGGFPSFWEQVKTLTGENSLWSRQKFSPYSLLNFSSLYSKDILFFFRLFFREKTPLDHLDHLDHNPSKPLRRKHFRAFLAPRPYSTIKCPKNDPQNRRIFGRYTQQPKNILRIKPQL